MRSKDKIAVPQVLLGDTVPLKIVLGTEKEDLLKSFSPFKVLFALPLAKAKTLSPIVNGIFNGFFKFEHRF